MNPFPATEDPEAFRAQIAEIAATHIPFGMFGPSKYPPFGVALCDLPLEYLAWFKERGFPKGTIGRLLEVTWELKSNGLASLFAPYRKVKGGSTLHKKRKNQWEF